MPDSDKSSPEKNNSKKLDTFDLIAWICAVIAFAPSLMFLYRGVIESRQLSDALIILVSMCLVLAIENKIVPHAPRFNFPSAISLAAAYAAFMLAQFCGQFSMFVIFAGLTALLVAIGLACLSRLHYVLAVGFSFYVFTILSLLINLFDLPLRVFAGKLSIAILSIFNPSAALVTLANYPPQIGMIVNGNTYLVATECNGFGLISSSIILSVLLVSFKKSTPIFNRLLSVLLSTIIAYIANSLRIVSIVLIAPLFNHSHYSIIHEACGYFFFAIALFSVYSISRK